MEEKRVLELTLQDEKALKVRLEGFKKLLESNKYLEEFDRSVFESIVDKIIIGGTNPDGEIDPALITIIYKTGTKDSQSGQEFKGRRKNAKMVDEMNNKLYPQSSNEVETLCSHTSDNELRGGGVVGERGIVVCIYSSKERKGVKKNFKYFIGLCWSCYRCRIILRSGLDAILCQFW